MDFTIISPYEFEKLCCDIMSHYLKKEMRFFKEGVDNGIDIGYINEHCFIFGQCKRYNSNNYYSLLNSLKQEVKKVKINNPNSYYVFTSMALIPKQVSEIYNIFKPYMADINCVFDKTKLEQLLSKEEFAYIKRRNIKLWIDSYSTLYDILKPDLSIDVDELINSIEKNKRIYTKTSYFYKAAKKLQEERIVLITGKAGVGKTTLSEMILLDFMANNKDCRVIYSETTDYKDLIRNIDKFSDNKEIIFINDFLGQSCVELSSNALSSTNMLISYVSHHYNKYLLINSRTQVLNETKNKNLEIFNKFQNIKLEISDLNKLERALILYNHIVTSEIGDKRINSLLKNKYYFKIINHSNYNPRLIKYLFNIAFYPTDESKYIDFVDYSLNHPEIIWENEYNYSIYPEDRMLIEILYSISNYSVDYEILQKAFISQKGNPNYSLVDFTKTNLFDDSLNRLYGGFVDVEIIGGKRRIKIANPSITDFINNVFINKSKEEIENFLDRSICFDQKQKIDGSNFYRYDNIKKMIDTKFIEESEIVNEYNYYKTIICIATYKMNKSDFFKKVLIDSIDYFEKSKYQIIELEKDNTISDFIVKILNKEVFDYYEFLNNKNIIEKLVEIINRTCHFYDIINIYKNTYFLDSDYRNIILNLALDYAIYEAIYEVKEYELIDSDDVKIFTDFDEELEQYVIDEEGLSKLVEDRIEDAILNNLDSFEYITEYKKIDSVSNDYIKEQINIFSESDEYVKDYLMHSIDYDNEEYLEQRQNTKEDIDFRISEMFNNLEND